MNKLNSKGFTLIEILAVIIILGLILAIAVPAVNKHLAEVRINYYDDLESSVLNAGKDYINEKRLVKPTKLLNSNVIKLSSLEKESFIGEVKDYLGNKCDSTDTKYSYVLVVKTGDKRYDYQVCLKCSNDEYVTDTTHEKNDYCNPAWLTNDYLEYEDPGDSDDVLYVQYGTSEEEIKPQVGLAYKVIKKDSDGNVLRETVDETSQKIYPSNINELVGANVNKTITLKYKIPSGKEITRKAIIYQHSAPNIKATYINANTQTGKAAGATYSGTAYDEWSNGVKFELGYSSSESELVKNNISIKNYEYYVEGSNNWVTISSGNTWRVTNNYKKKVKFRFKNQYDQYSKESRYYYISVDIDKPICTISGSNTSVTLSDYKDFLSGIGTYGMNIRSTSSPEYNKTRSLGLSKGTAFGYVRDKAGNTNECNLGIYTLTYNVNGGTAVSPSSKLIPTGVDYGTLPSTTKSANVFNGWATVQNGTSYATSAFKMGSQDVTLYASWGTCTACAAGTGANCTLSVVNNVCTYSTSCKTGYSNISNNGKYNPSCSLNTYTISYNANGGSGAPAAQTKQYGINLTLSSKIPTKANSVFTGWNTNSSGTGTNYASGATYTDNKGITLYAKWNACTACSAGTGANCTLSVVNNVCTYTTSCKTGYSKISNNGKYNPSCSLNTYTISYNANGGSGAPGAQTKQYGVNLTLSSKIPTKANSVFTGWNTNSSGTGTNYSAGGSYTANAALSLYAKWNACTACAAGTGANCTLSVVNNVCTYSTSCKSGYSNIVNNGKYNPSCSKSYPNLTFNVSGRVYICPSDNVGVQNRASRNSACKQGKSYNRLYVESYSYSAGTLTFNWNVVANDYSPTWDGNSDNYICIAKVGSTSCYSGRLGNYNVKKDSKLNVTGGTWGLKSASVDVSKYPAGKYKIIGAGTEKMAFSKLDYTDITFFTIS